MIYEQGRGTNEAKEQSAAESILRKLEDSATELLKISEAMDIRLQPILRGGPGVEKDDKPPTISSSPLVMNLNTLDLKLVTVIERFHRMMNRLDV